MKIVLQRVKHARLVSDNFDSEIGEGLIALVGVSKSDTEFDIKFLAKKIINIRLFDDEFGKTNLSLLDTNRDIMLVSNFTLLGDTRKGTRPDFSNAAGKDIALDLFNKLVEEVTKSNLKVSIGLFGHDMEIETKLDGPFTVVIESEGRDHE